MKIIDFFLCTVLLVVGVGFSTTVQAQDFEEYTRDSLWKSQQEYLNKHYIPVDEQDAFDVLQEISSEKGLAKFKKTPEDSIRGRLHFGLGMWMMQNWGLYSGSRLSYYLNGKGISSSDDMAEYLIITFHRHLNGSEINSQELIEELNLFRKKRFEETKPNIIYHDTLIYDKRTGEVKKKSEN